MRRVLAALVLACALVVVPAPASATSSDSVAVVGPSLAARATRGYYETGTADVLWPVYEIGGGTLAQWSQPGSVYWQRFDAMLAAHPGPATVWLYLADHDKEYRDLDDMRAQAHAVIELIHERLPDVEIDASSMYRYTSRTSCPTVAQAVKDTATVRTELIDEGLVTAGPVMPSKSPAELVRCDQDDQGRAEDGVTLHGFFDTDT